MYLSITNRYVCLEKSQVKNDFAPPSSTPSFIICTICTHILVQEWRRLWYVTVAANPLSSNFNFLK